MRRYFFFRSRRISRGLLSSLLPLLWLLGACNDATPTLPDEEPAASPIRFEDPSGLLRAHEEAIRAMANSTLARVAEALPITGVTITISSDASRAIGGYGVGGFTPNGSSVEIYVDSGYPGLSRVLPERLPPLLAHELHHARRWRGPGYGRTLLEAMASEGLADRFSVELLNAPPPPWTAAFPRERIQYFLALARPELDTMTYSHDRWFFRGDATLPRWTGYTLGYWLVERYQARQPGVTAAQLVDLPASLLRPD